MKKIILFSPNGYVGSFIKKRFEEEADIELYRITRESVMNQYLGDYDILVYSASLTSHRQEKVEKYIQDNVVAAVSMMAFCKTHHIKRIIYLSTDEIYGELVTDMVTEKAVMVNPGLYAATKYLAEKIIMESGIPYYILRLPGIVGKVWGTTFLYGLMDKLRNNESVALYNMDRGFNNIVDMDDLVQFIVLLCNAYCDDGKSEVFLLGNTDSRKLSEIVSYIKERYHSSSKVENIKADNRRYFMLNVSKASGYGYRSKEMKTIIDELYQIQG